MCKDLTRSPTSWFFLHSLFFLGHVFSKCHRFKSSCLKILDFSKSGLNHCPLWHCPNSGLLFSVKKTIVLTVHLVQFSMTLARKMAAEKHKNIKEYKHQRYRQRVGQLLMVRPKLIRTLLKDPSPLPPSRFQTISFNIPLPPKLVCLCIGNYRIYFFIVHCCRPELGLTLTLRCPWRQQSKDASNCSNERDVGPACSI